MLHDSYEQVIARDLPAYWWRLGRGIATRSIGRPGLPAEIAPAIPGPPYAGPGLPGAANGISSHCIGTSTAANDQGWFQGGHTVPGAVTAGLGITMEIWVFPQSIADNLTYSIFWRNAGGFRAINGNVDMAVNGTNRFTSAGTLLRNQWHHLVGIFRTDSNEMWVNGRRVRDVAAGTPDTATATDLATSTFTYIGRSRIPDSATRSWLGFLAEPALYPYALSPSQIVDHYQAGIMPRRSTARLASTMYPFTAPAAPPPPSGLTAIGDVVNKRVALVSDRPR